MITSDNDHADSSQLSNPFNMPEGVLNAVLASAYGAVSWLLPNSWEIGIMVVQMVKNPPAMRETWVWSLGWEDPLEEGMTIHSSILAWIIPWIEATGEL